MSVFKINFFMAVLYHELHVKGLSMLGTLSFLSLLSAVFLALLCYTGSGDPVGNRNVCNVFVYM